MYNLTRVTLLLFVLFLFLSTITFSQYIQNGNKLIGTGSVGASQQGIHVAVSGDGNTALVGGWGDNGNMGAAWIYVRSGNQWIQQGSKLTGTGAIGAAQFGFSVALSFDGNTALIGGVGDNGGMGATWVFSRSDSVWSQQGSKLMGLGMVGAGNQGFSVALSADGNTAFIGAPYDNFNVGAGWFFTRTAGVWTQQGSKVVGSNILGGDAYVGVDVALSADGNTAILGGNVDDDGVGATWVFTRSAGVWTQQGPKLVGSDHVGLSEQGNGIALSADGNTAVIGGWHDDGQKGAAWIFVRSGGVWSQQGSKLVGAGAVGVPRLGIDASISSDGNVIVVGAHLDNGGEGAAWVFKREGNTWSQLGDKLVGTGAISAQQGSGVWISADARTIIVGGYFDNSGVGAAWVFENVRDSTLVAYYPFNGNADDESGNLNHGSVSGGVLSADYRESFGNSYYFGGAGDLINLPDSLIYNHTKLSLGLWFKTTDGGVMFGYQSTDYPFFPPPQYVPALYVGVDGKAYAEFWNGDDTPIVTNFTVNDGNWHFMVLVGDDTTQGLYIDGILIGSMPGIIDHLSMIKNQIGIGNTGVGNLLGWVGGNDQWFGFKGNIDDVRLYNRALSATEIDSLFHIGGWPAAQKQIIATAGPNGSIIPAGTVIVNSGSSQVFTFTPNPGYHLDSVLVDGVNVPDSNSSYTFANVISNHTIHVKFAINTYSLNLTNVGSGTILKSPDEVSYAHGTNVQLTAVPGDNTWKFSHWEGDTSSAANPIFVAMFEDRNLSAVFVKDSLYLLMYRTFTPSELAEKNPIKKKPVGYVFTLNIVNSGATSATGLELNFGGNSATFVVVDSATKFGSETTSDHRRWIFGDGAVASGETVAVYGESYPGRMAKVVNWRWIYSGQAGPYNSGFTPVAQEALYPAPNYANVRDEVFNAGAFGVEGLVLGVARTDSSRKYGWVRVRTSKSFQQSLSDWAGNHQEFPRCFDFTREQKTLRPLQQNNVLFANLLALKFGIAASAIGVTQNGLGELLYDDGTSNPLNGLMVKEIAAKCDTLLMGWYSSGVHQCEDQAIFNNIYNTIARIDSAFDGPLDTLSFTTNLVINGTRKLEDVPYLFPNPLIMPEVIVRVPGFMPVEATSQFKLHQNYPNAFNPTTTIQFELPEYSLVTLKIYDILGKEVAVLLDREEMNGGIQEAMFDGSSLASGVYFYRLSAEVVFQDEESSQSSFTDMKKMMLIK